MVKQQKKQRHNWTIYRIEMLQEWKLPTSFGTLTKQTDCQRLIAINGTGQYDSPVCEVSP